MKFKNKKTGVIVEPHEKWLEEKLKKDDRYTAVSEKKGTADSASESEENKPNNKK